MSTLAPMPPQPVTVILQIKRLSIRGKARANFLILVTMPRPFDRNTLTVEFEIDNKDIRLTQPLAQGESASTSLDLPAPTSEGAQPSNSLPGTWRREIAAHLGRIGLPVRFVIHPGDFLLASNCSRPDALSNCPRCGYSTGSIVSSQSINNQTAETQPRNPLRRIFRVSAGLKEVILK